MLLWTALLRKLPQQVHNFENFHRDKLTGFECYDKTVAVVGVGHIGLEVVKIAQGLGMRVVGVDIDKKHDCVQYATIEDALLQADVIVNEPDLFQL